MKLSFTDHAKFRLLERAIGTEEIKETLRNPDYSNKRIDGKVVVGKNFVDYQLKVVYALENNTFNIITVIKL